MLPVFSWYFAKLCALPNACDIQRIDGSRDRLGGPYFFRGNKALEDQLNYVDDLVPHTTSPPALWKKVSISVRLLTVLGFSFSWFHSYRLIGFRVSFCVGIWAVPICLHHGSCRCWSSLRLRFYGRNVSCSKGQDACWEPLLISLQGLHGQR